MSNSLMSESITKIAPALLEAQRNMGNAVKDSKNPFFKSSYADLNSVREAALPSLNANGISVIQPTVSHDGKNFVRTVLLHSSGEWIASETEIISAKQNDPQAHGSGLSYARRYGLQSLLSLGAEDNDAEGAMNRPTYNKASYDSLPKGPVSTTSPKPESTPSTISGAELARPTGKVSSFRKPAPARPTLTEAATAVANGEWE